VGRSLCLVNIRSGANLPSGDPQNTVLVFILGLVATLGTVLSLAAIGGGAEIVRRNALTQLRLGGALVLAAVLLAGITDLSGGLQSEDFAAQRGLGRRVLGGLLSRKGLLTIAAFVGVLGLSVAGYGVTKRSTGRPAISVTFTAGPKPSLLIIVKAGGLKESNELNLYAAAFPNPSGSGERREPLIRASFGPDPSGDASIQAHVPVQVSRGYKSVVIRAWVGSPGKSGPCFLETVQPGKQPRTGCVLFPLVPKEIKKCTELVSGGPCGHITTGPDPGKP
jgi:hypothetical protein